MSAGKLNFELLSYDIVNNMTLCWNIVLYNAYVVSVRNSSLSLCVNSESFYTKAIFSLSLFAAQCVLYYKQ